MDAKITKEDFYHLVNQDGLHYLLTSAWGEEEIKLIDDPEIVDLCLKVKPILERLEMILLDVGKKIEDEDEFGYIFPDDEDLDEEE